MGRGHRREGPLRVTHLPEVMPLPVRIVAIRDPAYAHMLRSSGVRRPRASFRRHQALHVAEALVSTRPEAEPLA